MLVVFAPQILLYGLAVVLYGVLQAHRRFIVPAIALVSGDKFWWPSSLSRGRAAPAAPDPVEAGSSRG